MSREEVITENEKLTPEQLRADASTLRGICRVLGLLNNVQTICYLNGLVADVEHITLNEIIQRT